MSRVSVIIPVFNGAATVASAIESALAQTLSDREVIVVDDGSTDRTAAILGRYGDEIRVIKRLNGGIAAARNSGLRAARGDYIALLDCDDLWMPTMLERTVAALDADRLCVLAYTNLAIMNSEGHPLNTALVGPDTAHAPSFDELFERLWPIMPSAVLIRRAALNAIDGFAEEFRSYGYEDAYCWMRLRELGPFSYLAEPLVQWRFGLFPRPLKLFKRSPRAQATFARLVHERWGRSVAALLRSRMRASRTLLGYIGLIELREGNRVAAREAFRRALQLDRWRFKNYLRFLRTYLPAALSRHLGGRTSRPALTTTASGVDGP
jgi:glycosyltransferase involved in cell wall biosynthesis